MSFPQQWCLIFVHFLPPKGSLDSYNNNSNDQKPSNSYDCSKLLKFWNLAQEDNVVRVFDCITSKKSLQSISKI